MVVSTARPSEMPGQVSDGVSDRAMQRKKLAEILTRRTAA
jgi:hypothetical protein